MEPPPPPDHHFAPVNPDLHILDEAFDILHDEPVRYEERRPTVQQRMPDMQIHDDVPEVRPHKERTKSGEVLPDYVYYRLRRNGDNWDSAAKSRIIAPIEDIEKTVRKGKGGDAPILEQMKRMSDTRREMIGELVHGVNKNETGGYRFEVAYITAKRIRKRSGKVEVPEMDVILTRTKVKPKTKSKSKDVGEEIILKDTKKSGEKEKEKTHDEDGHFHSRKDSVLEPLKDPIANMLLFDPDGRPRDEFGPINFTSAGLPPQIPQERPLGVKPEAKKEEKKRGKSRKRSKSRGPRHGEDDIMMVGELEEFHDGADAPPVGSLFAEANADRRGRRGKSPHPTEHPEVVGGEPRRSHSRRRPATESRHHSRDKSRSRPSSVYIPNQHTRQYFHEDSASSHDSDSSRYSVVEYAESSATSLTSGGLPRRGSLVRHEPRPEQVYKTHRRGPTRSASYVDKTYRGEERVVIPSRSRRDSFVAYERPPGEIRFERPTPRLVRQMTVPIPEERQVLYHQDVVPIRRATEAPVIRYVRDAVPPVAGYPEEERDVFYREDLERRSSRVEDYQRERVREEYYKQREQELDSRQHDLEIAEADMRRLRMQEREYHDDRERRERERRQSKPLYYDEETGRYFYYE
ncbi:hypothetical protein PV08_01974 [Exophiala spinifera]|uniref:Apoptosis regulator Bcl-2 family BH4 domain-containing protein n=1 Tax=Exophiala spinifera TaxID=91928 RepID=A0A0D2CD11_9EURO|nr:uncharacterized protein PV08_01974 [Exophiala spinifera]KIW21394.1 hypothetical protein PV08_01974 [Exophiala spinifera]